MGHGHSYTCNQKMNFGLAPGHMFPKKKSCKICVTDFVHGLT
jgi:hypothetical protein